MAKSESGCDIAQELGSRFRLENQNDNATRPDLPDVLEYLWKYLFKIYTASFDAKIMKYG